MRLPPAGSLSDPFVDILPDGASSGIPSSKIPSFRAASIRPAATPEEQEQSPDDGEQHPGHQEEIRQGEHKPARRPAQDAEKNQPGGCGQEEPSNPPEHPLHVCVLSIRVTARRFRWSPEPVKLSGRLCAPGQSLKNPRSLNLKKHRAVIAASVSALCRLLIEFLSGAMPAESPGSKQFR